MAFIKFSGLVSSVVGKLNGSYFQSQKGGTALKTISGRRPSAKATQTALGHAQSRLGWAARQWAILSIGKVAMWNTFALNFTRVNKNGQTYTPTGYQIFNECNLNRLAMGKSLLSQPVEQTEPLDVAAFNVTMPESGGMVFDGETSIPEGKVVKISASAPTAGNKTFPVSPYKHICYVTQDETLPFIFTGLYSNVWGAPPNNMAYFFKLEVIDEPSGIQEGSKLTKADAGLI